MERRTRQLGTSRRDFLRGLGLGAVGAAGLGAAVVGAASYLRGASSGPDSESAAASSTTSSTDPLDVSSTTGEPARPDPSVAIPVICRDAWGAREPSGLLPPHEISKITVHHSASVLTDNTQAPSHLRSAQRFHLDEGFVDLAYHYVIDANGNVYEARSLEQPGETFTDYDPTGHLLITCEGSFDQQPVPDAQFEALVRMIAWGTREFAVSFEAVRTHRDYTPTECPGEALYARLNDGSLPDRVRSVVGAGVTTIRLCGAEGVQTVADIEAGIPS